MDLVRVIEILNKEIDDIKYQTKHGYSKKIGHQIQAVERVKDLIMIEIEKDVNLKFEQVNK